MQHASFIAAPQTLRINDKPSRLLVLMFEHRPGAKLYVPKSLRVFLVVSLVGVAIFYCVFACVFSGRG
jgi:hypothetical protein